MNGKWLFNVWNLYLCRWQAKKGFEICISLTFFEQNTVSRSHDFLIYYAHTITANRTFFQKPLKKYNHKPEIMLFLETGSKDANVAWSDLIKLLKHLSPNFLSLFVLFVFIVSWGFSFRVGRLFLVLLLYLVVLEQDEAMSWM